jgi:hypothetical protein
MQSTFSDLEYAAKKKVTRRDRMDIGQQLGKVSLVMSWNPSQRLDRTVKYGIIP